MRTMNKVKEQLQSLQREAVSAQEELARVELVRGFKSQVKSSLSLQMALMN